MLKTTVVGSYPVPSWLRVYGTRESLRDALMVILKTQELAGLDVISDGELYRWDINHPETNGMIDYFIRPLTGVEVDLDRKRLDKFRQQMGMAYRSEPAGVVTGKLDPGTLNLLRDWERVKPLTHKPLKFTVTSPYMLAKVLLDEHYRDLPKLVMALADILAEQLQGIDAAVIQVDEANLTGHPEDAAIAAQGINRVLTAAQGEKAVHLCFGNYGGQTIQKGTYQKLLEFMNALECDHLVLEMTRRPPEELAMLREVKSFIGMGIGVIDIKDNQVETPEQVAGRIEAAAKVLGVERLHYVHPDCGFWMLPRFVADAKMRVLVEGRDLFVGRK
ncbi:MAG: cobalamin-independent methionine synthase II family protein [candidate division KSB1 bacterium]|nr:cobalamin-independent methionine synthase II family protein [candidate division KSB1 bacterium]MDZ7300823.1 cobalamin-independent methionine synthase II family protein [candidate division KSB1 bacterium]MDZ7309906.1 cobalamin-independent methionine synthase II family protein [candidate division KSB1 bacterium]